MGFALGEVSSFWVNLLTVVSKTARASVIKLAKRIDMNYEMG